MADELFTPFYYLQYVDVAVIMSRKLKDKNPGLDYSLELTKQIFNKEVHKNLVVTFLNAIAVL